MKFLWFEFPVRKRNGCSCDMFSILQEIEKQKANTKLAEQQLVNQQQVLQQEKVRISIFDGKGLCGQNNIGTDLCISMSISVALQMLSHTFILVDKFTLRRVSTDSG
ncbi:hypothetical protein M758_6G203200 [Ceratodon purpureus]|nr:hypothetical protein M758_6G203200 [Ceratodon purpureus]